VEVKRPESADKALDVEDPGNEEEGKPNQAPVKPTDVTPRTQPEDTQLKKALELLRDKRPRRSALPRSGCQIDPKRPGATQVRRPGLFAF